MKNYYRRRKFTTYKFFVEGQVGKVFFRRQKNWKDGFWMWHIGFAVGKSTRQVNDWYYMKQNKRAKDGDEKAEMFIKTLINSLILWCEIENIRINFDPWIWPYIDLLEQRQSTQNIDCSPCSVED